MAMNQGTYGHGMPVRWGKGAGVALLVVGALACDQDDPVRPVEEAPAVSEQGPSPEDERLREAVAEALADADGVPSGIEVEVEGAVATLSGRAKTAAERERAITAAWSVPGVAGVDDHMGAPRVPDEVLERRLQQALMLEPSSALNVRAQVAGGVAILEGDVENAECKLLVQQVANSVPGVRRVVDRTVPRQLHVRLIDTDKLASLREELTDRTEETPERQLALTPTEERMIPREVPFHSVVLERGESGGRLLFFREDVDCSALPPEGDEASDVLVMSVGVEPVEPSWEGALETTHWRRWEPLPLTDEEADLTADGSGIGVRLDEVDDDQAMGRIRIRSAGPGRAFRIDGNFSAVVCTPAAE